jgi:hypothetical protein
MGPTQLMIFRFPSTSELRGQMLGAFERVEAGGTLRIVDARMVARYPDSGELAAISVTAQGSSGMIGRLIGFRLDQSERGRMTERALEGPHGDELRELAARLGEDGMIIAVLVEHAWATNLEDAVRRTSGEELASELVEGASLTELWPRVLAATAT